MLLFAFRGRPSMHRSPIRRGMGPLGVVDRHPIFDDAPGLEAISDFFEIDRFLLKAAPEPFDEDVVEVEAPTVYRDAHANLGQCRDPSRPRELRPLICIHDFRRAMFADGLVQSLNTKVGVHRVRQPRHADHSAGRRDAGLAALPRRAV